MGHKEVLIKRGVLIGPIALTLALLGPGLSGVASADSTGLGHVTLSKQQSGAAGYWTKARRAEAVPAPLPASASTAPPEPSATPQRGRPQLVQPKAPTVHRDARIGRATPVPDPAQFPYSTSGLVLFDMDGGSYGCSGTVVQARNRSVVFTAGHCVNDGGGTGSWARHWVFAPGYHDGVAPYGYFGAREIWSTGPWLDSGNFSYDMGAVVLRARNGQRVQSVAGARGIAFNRPRNQIYDAFGYPGGAPFDGEHQEECLLPYLGSDTGNPPTFSIACDMTEGASGGGWIVDGKYENGLTSYGYTNEPGVLYSPYFGTAAQKLWRRVRGR